MTEEKNTAELLAEAACAYVLEDVQMRDYYDLAKRSYMQGFEDAQKLTADLEKQIAEEAWYAAVDFAGGPDRRPKWMKKSAASFEDFWKSREKKDPK